MQHRFNFYLNTPTSYNLNTKNKLKSRNAPCIPVALSNYLLFIFMPFVLIPETIPSKHAGVKSLPRGHSGYRARLWFLRPALRAKNDIKSLPIRQAIITLVLIQSRQKLHHTRCYFDALRCRAVMNPQQRRALYNRWNQPIRINT